MKSILAWALLCDDGKTLALNLEDETTGIFKSRAIARRSIKNVPPDDWRREHRPRPVRVRIEIVKEGE